MACEISLKIETDFTKRRRVCFLRNEPPKFPCVHHRTNAKLKKTEKRVAMLPIQFVLSHMASGFFTFIGLSPVETKEKLGTFTKECKRF
jgi:hypothetical protein